MPETMSAELTATMFQTYLCRKYAASPHVHRVGPWLGFLTEGLAKLGASWSRETTRQLWFQLPGEDKWYKARFRHGPDFGRPRGGIEFVQMDGNHDGPIVKRFASQADARAFYDHPSMVDTAAARQAA